MCVSMYIHLYNVVRSTNSNTVTIGMKGYSIDKPVRKMGSMNSGKTNGRRGGKEQEVYNREMAR